MPPKRRRTGKEPVTECTYQPKQSGWRSMEKYQLEQFGRVTVHPTRFIDRDILERMRLLENVDILLENMGLSCLSHLECPTYEQETKHFLATVTFEFTDPKNKKASEGFIRFKVDDMKYRLTVDEICDTFSFPKSEAMTFPPFKGANAMWDTIAHGNWRSSTAKMTMIKNPVIRYVSKLLSNTIFARKEAGAVTMKELSLLYIGLKHVYTSRFGSEFDGGVNLGCVLAAELASLKKWAQKPSDRDLWIGGMLTPLMERAGVDLRNRRPIQARNYIDREYLTGSWFLKGKTARDVFHYHIRTRHDLQRTMVLPCIGKTNISSIEIVRFDLGEEEYLEQGLGPMVLVGDPVEEIPRADLDELDEMELPDIDFPVKTPRERLLHQAYKVQKKINELQKRLIKKLFRKIKKIQPPEYVSSDEEDAPAEAFPDEDV